MVKGVSKRVLVVKSPDPRYFEEAIFILREDMMQTGCSPEDILREAGRAVDGYVRKSGQGLTRKKRRRIPSAVYAAAGAAATGAIWLAGSLLRLF